MHFAPARFTFSRAFYTIPPAGSSRTGRRAAFVANRTETNMNGTIVEGQE
jgi:hypothetical protein